jgi:hypothetical protein
MAEAIAALSLASNILQVIDFGTSFASTAWKIYQGSRHGRRDLDDVASLRSINSNLRDALRDIRTQSASVSATSESTSGILDLSKQCSALAEQLLQSLDSLGLADVKRKRDALRAAFRLSWKKEEIGALETRLNDFRSQLTLSLLVSMRLVIHICQLSWFSILTPD